MDGELTLSLHPDIIAALVAAGGTSDMIIAVCRAAHEVEMKAKMDRRAPAAARQKRRRGRDLVDDMQEPQDEQKFIDAALENESMSHESHESHVTKENPPTPPKENTSSLCSEVKKDDDEEDAGATVAEKPLVSQKAFALADTIGRDAGFEPSNTPPGWCGAAYVIQKFLDDGCPGEIVRLGCTTALRRKRDGPPERFVYFEKPIAQAFADYRRPVPEVAVRKLEVIDGGGFGSRASSGYRPTSSTHGSLGDAARELRRKFARQADEIERAENGMDRGEGRNDGGVLPSG